MSRKLCDLAEKFKRRIRLYAKFDGESGHVELPLHRIDTTSTPSGAIRCEVLMFMMPRQPLHFMERATRTEQPVLFGLDCTELPGGPRILFHGLQVRPAPNLCFGTSDVAYLFDVVKGGFVTIAEAAQ